MNLENKVKIISHKHHIELVEEKDLEKLNEIKSTKSSEEEQQVEENYNKNLINERKNNNNDGIESIIENYLDKQKMNIFSKNQNDLNNNITCTTPNSINENSIPIEISNSNEVHANKNKIHLKTNKNFKILIKNKKPIFYKALPLILGTILYFITLMGCHEQYHVCLKKYPPKAMLYGFMVVFLSAFFYTYQILLYLKKKVCFKYIIIELAIILFLCLIYDTGTDLINHGGYNRLILIFSMIIWGILFSLFALIYKIFKKFPKIISAVLIIFSLLCYFHIHKIFYESCQDWMKGFKQTRIFNQENINFYSANNINRNTFAKSTVCNIKSPGVCYYKLLDGSFDVSAFLNVSCKNDKSNNLYANIQPYIKDENATVIGFPLTNKFNISDEGNLKNIQKNVLNRIVNMENRINGKNIINIKNTMDVKDNYTNYNEHNNISYNSKDIEVLINYNVYPPKVELKINRDENLIKSRQIIKKEKYKNKTKAPLVKNVIHIFIDSVSRVNFRRKLPKFYEWIEEKYIGVENLEIAKNYTKNVINTKDAGGNFNINHSINSTKNNNTIINSHESFQFFKMHGVGRYTRVNMVPTFFGIYNTQTEIKANYFLKHYKDRGFLTGYSLDYCSKEVFEIEDPEMNNLIWDTYDHEFISLFCDPNFEVYNDPFSMSRGPNSLKKKCIYNKYAIEYQFEYMTQFFEAYKNENKFFKLGIVDAHEGTYEAIKYDDRVLVEFFKKFEEQGYLNDTILIIQTDHGNTQPGPYSALHLEDFVKELSLPALFVIIPKNMKDYDIIRKKILTNEQKFITPFTIHNSLLKILNDDENVPYSINDKYSILSNDIPERTCRDFKIDSFLCRCQGEEE